MNHTDISIKCFASRLTRPHRLPAAGNEAASKRLLDEGALRQGGQVFLSVWGLEATPDGGLALPAESAAEHPLLAVMLARLKALCLPGRLLAMLAGESYLVHPAVRVAPLLHFLLAARSAVGILHLVHRHCTGLSLRMPAFHIWRLSKGDLKPTQHRDAPS